jgi:hypothetical protein
MSMTEINETAPIRRGVPLWAQIVIWVAAAGLADGPGGA